MKGDLEQPQLLITRKTGSDLHGSCSTCGRTFHAFVRSTEKEAVWLLTRGFKLHCRKVHSLVIHPALAVDEMVESLPLPAYVCAKGSRKVLVANQHFRNVMGYAFDDVAELRLDDLRPAEDMPLLLESLQRSGGGTLDRRYRAKDGRFLQVRLRYQDINVFQNETPVRDARFVVLTSIQAAGGNLPNMKSDDKNARVGKSAERRHPRFAVDCEVEVLCGATAIQAHVIDVSESGMAVNTPRLANEGERVLLRFMLPNSEHRFGVQATVKYSKGDRHGLEFYKLPRRESDELWHLCRALSATA